MKYKVGDVVKGNRLNKKEDRYIVTNHEYVGVVTNINKFKIELDNEYWVYKKYFDLQVPQGKKLEYGYCQIGDIILDEDGDERIILDVRERLIDYGFVNNNRHAGTRTYEEAQELGWTIKHPEEEITPKENKGIFEEMQKNIDGLKDAIKKLTE